MAMDTRRKRVHCRDRQKKIVRVVRILFDCLVRG